MRVFVYPADNYGCGNYRLTWPAQAAAEADHSADIIIIPPEARTEQPRFDPRTYEVITDGFEAETGDVIVFQRPTHFFHSRIIRALRTRGVTVVVDMDDDLSAIDARNSAFGMMAPNVIHPGAAELPPVEQWQLQQQRVPNANSYHHATESCRAATMVVVTTPLLAKTYGAHGRVRVLPNYVPAAYLAIPHEDSDTFGWPGSMHSHPHDPQVMGPAVARLVQQGHRFETVGNPAGVARALGLRDEPPSTGDVEPLDWAPSIARLGIGVAPLADTRFNHSKSRLKPLELNAVGVPAVASPTADYLAWAEASGGTLIARKPREWERVLRGLLRDSGRRMEMSAAGRAAAAENTIEGNAFRWLEAWADAVDLQRGKVTAGAG